MLRRDLEHALRKKRPGQSNEDFRLHQDNAPPHTAKSTSLDIDILGFSRVRHPPYSPDLAPCDFEVFPRLKRELRGFRHADREELVRHVQSVVRSFPAEWYRDIFHKWVQRHEKNVAANGRYFEKL